MNIIDDLKKAIDAYETDNVKTEILNVQHGGNVLNVGEGFSFFIKVTNQSNLDMRNVQVRVFGTEYADVKFGVPGGYYGSTAVSSSFTLDAHQSYLSGPFFGYSRKITSVPKDIMSAQIYKWDASLDHILKDHSGAGAKEGKLNIKIHND